MVQLGLVEEASDTGAKMLVTGCPFCVLNLEDSVKGLGSDIVLRDMAELLDGTFE